MKVTTVAILVVCFSACCNAQKHVSTSHAIRVATDIRNGVGTAKYYQQDSTHAVVMLREGRSFNELTEKGFYIVKTFDKRSAIVHRKRNVEFPRELVEQLQPVNYLWKLSDNLVGENSDVGDALLIQARNPELIKQKLTQYGISTSLHGKYLIIRGNVKPEIAMLLLEDNVTYIGNESLTAREEGRVLELYHGPNKINKVHHEYSELSGEGITISIKERQFNPGDIDLLGKSVASSLADQDTSNHATEMATLVAGSGNSFITGRGVTSRAKLVSSSFANLFPDNESFFVGSNTFLQNHAYGTVVENFYGALANAYDVSVNATPKILHVFSSGNSGASMAASGVYVNAPGYSNLTGNSKMSKNALVVGCVDTTGNVVNFSSRGPAHDGRIKPELVAYSTAGTSNAAALVSGAAALLQQAYKTMKGSYPDAALLKALLINAADDVGPTGIDFVTGYGNLNAYRSVKNLKSNMFFEGIVNQGEIKVFDVALPANVRNLKATLVWNDPAAAVNSSMALVNNLDLEIIRDGATTLPWILDPTPAAPALEKSAVRGIDNLNNIEQISIDQPSSTNLQIRVKGTSTTSQKFFIAYQWDEAGTFTWYYPTGSDNFPYNGETGTYFFWNSLLTDATGDLEVTLDDGESWTEVASNLELKKGFYRWENPFMVNAAARARMVIGTTAFETDEFTISRAINPTVGFNCADSVLLQWPMQEGVSKYQVARLDGNVMTVFTTQPDTALVVRKTDAAIYYAIQPVLPNGKALLRSPAVNINTYGAGCFVSAFVDESISEEGIVLRLELGTTYAVNEVLFEHLAEGAKQFVTIETVDNFSSNIIRHLHTAPVQGLNRYRARIRFSNGQEVLTDTLQNFFLTKIPFIVFPNPVEQSQDLNIFSGRFETVDFKFHLFKADGSLFRSFQLSSDRDFVSMEGMLPGLYLYRIEGSSGRFSGKLVVK